MDKITSFGDCHPIDSYAEKNDLGGLVDQVKLFMDKSISEKTKKAYKSDWSSFTNFCEDNDLSPMPADPSTVSLYISHLAVDGKAVATIQRHLTTISQAHAAFRINSPTTDFDTVRTFSGIKRSLGTAQKKAKPIIWTQLVKIVNAMRPSIIGKRDRAMLMVGWSAALRRSEIVALEFADIEFVDEGMIVIIRRSKTDQEGEGFKIGVPWAKDKRLCPANSMKEFIDRSQISSGPLFFALGRKGKQFFMPPSKDRHRLSPKSINLILSRRLKDAGIKPAGYSGHSLRAGYITTAAKAKIPEHLIQIHTRHASVKVLRGYIREGSLFTDNPLSVLF